MSKTETLWINGVAIEYNETRVIHGNLHYLLDGVTVYYEQIFQSDEF